MAYQIYDNGDIELIQGDNIDFPVEGLPTDKNYTLFFAIYDENRRRFGDEIPVQTQQKDKVIVSIPSYLTDLLTVPVAEDSKEYYYGLKLCYEPTGEENTLLIGNGSFGDLSKITVYPKKVEGIITGA